MKSLAVIFLKVVVCFIAVGALAILLRFPQTEGRAANLDIINIYVDPVIIYIYLGSIPFFVALFQTFKILGLIVKNKAISRASLKAFSIIKNCALIIIGFLAGFEAYIYLIMRNSGEDIAGGVAVGIFLSIIALVITSSVYIVSNIIESELKTKSR